MDDLTRHLLDAQTGDRIALAAAIRCGQPDVWRMAAHLVGRSDADDVAQEVFVRAYRALPGFRADASGRTWLLAIARRTCADSIRAAARRRRLASRLASVSASKSREPSRDGALDLARLVSALAPAPREAFVLTQVVGCSYAEAAELCGVAVGTIRSRVARARETLVEVVRAADAV